MSWLLFTDESGHDHKTMPYEVRGGVAIHAKRLWAFVQAMKRLELDSFGTELHQFGTEIKGSKLLDKKRVRWSDQSEAMDDQERRKLCRTFLTKGLEKKSPVRDEFTAYGQACVAMALGVFQLLRDHDAGIFASVIPCSAPKPETFQAKQFLRKDHVFLLERFYDFLAHHREQGLLVMDQVERTEDRRFLNRLHRYFTRSDRGRRRTKWIVPAPLFVDSELSYPVQAADLAIYCVNWGFRLPKRGMDKPTRPKMATLFGPWVNQLQFQGEAHRDGVAYPEWGIVYVPDPYESRSPNSS